MTRRSPLVSVAMATFNGMRFLEAQLGSILSQLERGDEVVVIDDDSIDGTPAFIESAASADGRLRLLRNETNLGVLASFGRALTEVRGKYVFLSDQDDVWLPGKVTSLVEPLSRGALLAISDAEIIDSDGRTRMASFMAGRGGFQPGLLATLVRNRYLGCAMAFRRELLDHVLPIPPGVPMHDMWIGTLASLRGHVAYVNRPLMQYRRHGGNVSPATRASLGRMLAWRWRLLTLVLARLARGPRNVTPDPAN